MSSDVTPPGWPEPTAADAVRALDGVFALAARHGVTLRISIEARPGERPLVHAVAHDGERGSAQHWEVRVKDDEATYSVAISALCGTERAARRRNG